MTWKEIGGDEARLRAWVEARVEEGRNSSL
jgi:hypothetical protein